MTRDEEILSEWKSKPSKIGGNTGHGHVWKRPDGVLMRCGGPGMCAACTADLRKLERERQSNLLDLIRRVRLDEREECAKVAINATRIPDDAIRRGTGVRDRIVIEG